MTMLATKQWIIKQGKEYRLTTNICHHNSQINCVLQLNRLFFNNSNPLVRFFSFSKKEKKNMPNVALFTSHLYFLLTHFYDQQTLQAIYCSTIKHN